MQKIKIWYYNLYKMRLTYKIDKEAMVAYVDINKPINYVIGDDKVVVNDLCGHFNAAGYHVIVRY